MSCAEYERFAEYYDHVVAYRTRQDVAFFVSLAREAGGPVLEAGCGTGRVLIPTARAGVTIDGLDRSARMLELCRENLAREPDEVRARVRLHEGDMRSFELDGRFALITLPFRSFQHLLTVDDQLQALATLRRHLAPGGRLVVDVFNPSLPFLVDEKITVEPYAEPAFTMPDGRHVVRKYRIPARDYFTQVQQVEFTMEVTHPDGRQERHIEAFPLRYFFRYELEHLLERSGFHVEALYGDYDRSEYGKAYPGELIFVCR
ncbi:MAG TPA: class I SAM-dependent methyltransferase [Vicinamibacterales bacterium]